MRFGAGRFDANNLVPLIFAVYNTHLRSRNEISRLNPKQTRETIFGLVETAPFGEQRCPILIDF